ncbi:hypothetical protein [Halosolutus gelatinilyticus]|uniref:hypothetical protein n=1 Tax=Halosolutus gelatinilyticus TaxID=2931975 RepID=UPI001FF5B2D3|nr:hypothetical protein [Halosolutus gelatinilyticus]
MDEQTERTVLALAIGLPIGLAIGAVFVIVFDELLLGLSSALTFGIVIAALLANRWREKSN